MQELNLQATKTDDRKEVDVQRVHADSTDSVALNTAIDRKFQRSKTLLRLTGLYFEDSVNSAWYWVNVLRAGIFLALAVHQVSYVLYYLLSRKVYDASAARSLVFFNWMLQAAISEGIFIYWQSRGYISRLFKSVHCDHGCPRTTGVINRTLLLSFSLYAFAALYILLTAIMAVTGNEQYAKIFDAGLLHTMSLTITYLTFLLQLQYKDDSITNSTSSLMTL